MIVVEVLIPRMGGYAKWERSRPMPSGEAYAYMGQMQALGYKARIAERLDQTTDEGSRR